MFRLSTKSEANLLGVDADLQAVVRLAIQLTDVDFSVVEGLRSPERQQELVDDGKSWTLDSYHITGEAVDLYPWVDGATSHETGPYNRVAKAMFKASQQLGVQVEWGGFWTKHRDKPHWQKVPRRT